MKAEPIYILDFIRKEDTDFIIPPYQRNYEWDIEQCKFLLEDIVRTYEQRKNNILVEHFFGTIIYFTEGSGVLDHKKVVLTDGQQRITSSMLFVAAVRDLIPDENKKRKLDKSFLFNIDEGFKEVRLEQIEKDYKTYLQILCHEEIFNKNSIVYTNYKFFYDKLSEYLTLNPGAPLEELVTEGLGKFQIVAIELDPIRYRWENPQDIFESMNSLGKPLSLSDLVRNYLLIGFNPDKQRKLYKDYWMKIEDNLSGHISDFIRDYMQMEGHKDFKKATPSNSKELYRDFKTLFSDRSPEELMKDLSRFSEFYSWIINSDCHSGNKKVDRLLSDFRHIKASVIHSLLLELLVKWQNGEIDEFTLIEIMDVFRIFLLRRRTMQLTTRV